MKNTIKRSAVSSLLTITLLFHTTPGCTQTTEYPAEQALLNKGFSQDWVDALTERGEPRWYAGDELNYVGLPVGGLYAGQLYLGGDGRLWYWDIFNQAVLNPGGPGDKFYNTPMLPKDYRGVSSGFVLEVNDQAVMLDGRGFKDVRFRGEYPIGRVRLSDDDLPVAVELEAFSPFSPTDSDLSSLPATVMHYTLTNTSDKPIEVRVGGWFENAGNRRAVRAGVMQGRVSEIEGIAGLLLSADAATAEASAREDQTIQDFEDGYGDWVARGDAFGDSPFVQKQQAAWQTIVGSQAAKLANTHNTRVGNSSVAADQLTGTLTSPAIEIKRKFISFLVAGGSYTGTNVAGGEVNGATAVQVIVDGKVIATTTGENTNTHRAANIDVTQYQGKKATIRIVDSRTGGWGHIQADDFIQTDTPRQVSTLAADTGTMAFARLDGKALSIATDALPGSWEPALNKAGDTIPDNSGVLRSETVTLAPGASAEFSYAVAWHFENGQLGSLFPGEITRRGAQRNYYTKTFDNAAQVISHLAENHEDLATTTRLWRDTWYDSTLPVWLLDRLFLSTNCLATTAAFRMHDAERKDLDGRTYFWEGVYLGPGTCTHVTHYEQAFGRLFPDAARAQREVTDFNAGWDDNLGYSRYRAEWGIGQHFGIPHAIDGHAGTILRTYREHTTSTDDAFLKAVWPRVKRAVRFMIDQDAGRGFFATRVPEHARNQVPDGVLEGPQYHTLDKYWNGVIPWHSGLYLASLRATAEMARDMGDDAFADECHRIAELGKVNLAERTFNEAYGYFVQHPETDGEQLINTNIGCHVDQLLGNYWTQQANLAPVFPQEKAHSALAQIFNHNFYRRNDSYRKDALIKVHRYYADDDEPGTFICTFPHGGAREAVPSKGNDWDGLVAGYFSENMTGFTYPVAAQLIEAGMVTEGLALCRAIHDRYAEAPLRRNPFNEIEYGNHYTRAMSSYGVYLAASGFSYHGPRGAIGFAPKIDPENFRGAFTAAEGWGSYRQSLDNQTLTAEISLAWGTLSLQSIRIQLPDASAARIVKIDAQPVTFDRTDDGAIIIKPGRARTLKPGQALQIEVGLE